MSHWVFILAAIGSNVCLNLSLKSLSIALGQLSGKGVLKIFGSVLITPAFWMAGVSGLLLIGCFMMAIRELPLSMSYAAITGGAMAGLAIFGLMMGSESFSMVRLLGLSLVICGIFIMSRVA